MGAVIDGRKGGELAPLAIHGKPLQAISYTTPIASAQVKSAVLIAGLLAEHSTTIREPMRSRDHTERILQYFGVRLDYEDEMTIHLCPSSFNAKDISIPGDFSSAAFFLVAGLILPDSNITIRNVGLNQTRIGLLDILMRMGASIRTLNIHDEAGEPVGDLQAQSSQLEGVAVDPTEMLRAIDEFPILCIAAAFAKGNTFITQVEDLRMKESDRIAGMAEVLLRLGINVREYPNGLTISGGTGLVGAECSSYGDHRVAMAAAIAGLNASGTTTVTDVECIQTSFPGFLETLQQIVPASCHTEAA